MMTQPDEYTHRAANAIPNGTQPDITQVTVESIMAERGVGKRQIE